VLDTGDPDTPFGMPFVPNLFKAIAHNPAGGTDATLVELMAIVDLFSGFNKMLEGLQVAPDIGA
jgi:alkylhydroperoxidase family enzyme